MIEDSVMIHDKFQFQVKLTYDVNEKKKDTEYHVDTFIFLPKSFGINHNSYASKDFYNDTQTFIRYKTPVHSLKELASGLGPLEMLGKGDDFEFHLKLFCCIIKSAIRDAVKNSSRFDAKSYVAHVGKVRDAFRSIDVPKACKGICALR
jgi:hypothetical protein